MELSKNQSFCENSLNARSCWGIVVSRLKSLNLITLYTACGEIRDVKFDRNTLIVNVVEDFLLNILTKEENLKKIQEFLMEIDSRIEVKFVRKINTTTDAKENLERLSNLFGEELNFK